MPKHICRCLPLLGCMKAAEHGSGPCGRNCDAQKVLGNFSKLAFLSLFLPTSSSFLLSDLNCFLNTFLLSPREESLVPWVGTCSVRLSPAHGPSAAQPESPGEGLCPLTCPCCPYLEAGLCHPQVGTQLIPDTEGNSCHQRRHFTNKWPFSSFISLFSIKQHILLKMICFT